MKFLRDKGVAIIACADTKLVRRSGRSTMSLAGEVLTRVLAHAGLTKQDVDGLAMTVALAEAGNPFWTNLAAEALGLSPSWTQLTDLGGASAIANVARAAAAIHAGACETVVCLAADAPTTQDLSRQTGYRTEFADPSGYSGPPMVFGLLSSSYAHRHGLPDAAMAKLAVAQRQGALLNPNACDVLKVPLTEANYLSSRMIADPIRMLDCVMRCDGANAVIVTTAERARRLGVKRMAIPLAYREVTNFDPRQEIEDITMSGFSLCGPAALRDAGMAPADIDMLQPYDDFLIAVVLQLEQIGFAPAGGGGDFILAHDVSFRGNLPINTGGGQISAGQPGLAGGGVNLTEAVTQLFGAAGERQVRRARTALVTGIGAMQYARNWGTSAALVLEAA
jgi:acetyl-CoA acetyltransferase